MTVKDLIKELKQYPDDALVFVNDDWDAIEEGHYTKLLDVSSIVDGVVICEGEGFADWEEEHHVIIEAY